MRQSTFLFALLCLVLASASHADNYVVTGQKSPAFINAKEDWLAGNDLIALQALSKLSRDGNPAAQILLASIATRGHLHAHVTSELQRKERIALLRYPKGLSGKSWLTEAEKTEPLATALLQSARVGEKGAAIAALIEMGEAQTALLAGNGMLLSGGAVELLSVLQGMDDKLPYEASFLLIRALSFFDLNGNTGYTGSARIPLYTAGDEQFLAAQMAWVPPNPAQIMGNKEVRQRAIDLRTQVESWTPMTQFCDNNCPSSAGTCTAVGVSLLYGGGPFGMRSPLQSIISNEVYWSSERIEGDLARSVPDLSYYYNNGKWDMRNVNACFFEAMKQAQAIHGHSR